MAGFEIQSFLKGFLGEKARQITARKEKAEEEIDYFKRNQDQFIQAAEQRQQLRDNAGLLAKRLENYNVSPEMIAAAAAEGPTGLTDLSRTLESAVSKHGLDFVKNNIGMYVEAVVDKSALGEDYNIDTILDKAYGINDYEAGDYKPTKEYGFFEKLFGQDALDKAYAELDKEPVWNGMSLYDVRQYAQNKAYNDVGGDSYIKYMSPLVFGADDVSGEVLEINRIKNTVEENEDYIAAEADIKTLTDRLETLEAIPNVETSEQFGAEYKEVKRKLEQAKAKKAQVLSQFLDPYLEGRIATYTGDTYMQRMASSIDSIFGVQGYADKFNIMEDGAEPVTTTTASAAAGSGRPEFVFSDDPTIKSIEERIGVLGIDFKVTPEGLLLVFQGKTYSEGETKAFFEKNADSLGDLTYNNVLAAMRETSDTGAVVEEPEQKEEGLSFFEKGYTIGANEMGVATDEEDEEPEEEEPTGSGLSFFQKGFTIGANEAGVPKEEEEEAEPTAEDTPATMDVTEGPNIVIPESAGGATKALLETYGKSLQDFAISEGLSRNDSDEDIKEALAGWYSDNAADEKLVSMSTGVDDNVIVEYIRRFLNTQNIIEG